MFKEVKNMVGKEMRKAQKECGLNKWVYRILYGLYMILGIIVFGIAYCVLGTKDCIDAFKERYNEERNKHR